MAGIGVLDGISAVSHVGRGRPRNSFEIGGLAPGHSSFASMPGRLAAALSGLRPGGGVR
jgi:hypothetical protein